jgi:signal recognition particle subunit SRP54
MGGLGGLPAMPGGGGMPSGGLPGLPGAGGGQPFNLPPGFDKFMKK